MSDTPFQSFKGHYLLAMPGLADPNFAKTVVFLCEHSQEGAMGFVINRPSEVLGAVEIFQEFSLESVVSAEATPVFAGGPVQLDQIFLLHGPPFDYEGTYLLSDAVALSNSMETLTAVAKGEGPEKVALFLGSSGWGSGQLEGELAANVWLT
ncbi:MAG: YqgE/AlgH family protein, partial [Desulfobacterales bacterium]|nr:YqgE/AlgH family protein [Desulfobacterales bacterium]